MPAALHEAPAPRRVALAGGGTAGHVHPALAIAEAWRARRPDVEVTFLGTADGFEARVVPAHGLCFVPVPAAPLLRTDARGKLRALTTTLRGARHARRVFGTSRPDLLLAFGNYACAGVVLGARSRGIPVVLHEANVAAGVANRLLSATAARVLLGFGATAGSFPAGKTAVTGTPVRRELLSLRKAPPDPARPLRLLVTGGSQGSPFLDARAPELVARVVRLGVPCAVRHQAVAAATATVAAAYCQVGVGAEVVPFIEPMVDAYAWADVALTCAGAVTLAELASVGLPAVLVPLAGAALDHQAANAREAARITGCCWAAEATWSPDPLAEHLTTLARSPAAWTEAAMGMRRLATPSAAERIVEECEAVIAARAAPRRTPRV